MKTTLILASIGMLAVATSTASLAGDREQSQRTRPGDVFD